MAVNYNLSGFTNGSAYGYFYSNDLVVVNIIEGGQYVSIVNTLTTTSNLRTNIDSEDAGAVLTELSGLYYVKYSISTQQNNSDNFEIAISINDDAPLENTKCVFNSKQNDEYTTTSSCIIKLNSSGLLRLKIKNLTDNSNISIQDINITLIRVGDVSSNNTFASGDACTNLRYSGTDNFSFAEADVFYPFAFQLDEYNNKQILSPSNNIKIIQNGFYLIDWNISCSGASNQDLQMGLMFNGNSTTNILPYPRQKFQLKGGSLFQSGFTSIINLKTDDQIYFALANNTSASGNAKFESFSAVVIRVGNI